MFCSGFNHLAVIRTTIWVSLAVLILLLSCNLTAADCCTLPDAPIPTLQSSPTASYPCYHQVLSMLLTCILARPSTEINVPLYLACLYLYTRYAHPLVLVYVPRLLESSSCYQSCLPPAFRPSPSLYLIHRPRRTKGCDRRRGLHDIHKNSQYARGYCGPAVRDPRPRSAFAQVTPCLRI